VSGKKRHAEIAGGGITGLTLACALAQRGWSVRVHERAKELREIGAGIFLKENSIAVLKGIGTFDSFRDRMVRLREGKVFDESRRVLLHRVTDVEQSYATLRGELHRMLADAAVAAGAEIAVNSQAVGARADGALVLADGKELKADLVAAADGYRSQVRDSLGLARGVWTLPEGATRLLVKRNGADPTDMQQEHWSGRYRVGFTPCSASEIYIFMMAPHADRQASMVPVDKAFWIERFPHLSHLIDRIEPDSGNNAPLALVNVKSWSAGNVAILGDAAHAQPPNLGQGAGTAMANAHALAKELDAHADVTAALAAWEQKRRPSSEAVKRWSYRYGLVTGHWPDAALPLRSALIWAVGHAKPTRTRWGWLWRGGIERGADVQPG